MRAKVEEAAPRARPDRAPRPQARRSSPAASASASRWAARSCARPPAFLMDEPLSNLDAKLRVHMRAEVSRIQRRLGVATLYVTHDQVEAMTMGDRVAVMRVGPAAAVRAAAGGLRRAGQPVRRRVHRLPGDEPLPGRRSTPGRDGAARRAGPRRAAGAARRGCQRALPRATSRRRDPPRGARATPRERRRRRRTGGSRAPSTWSRSSARRSSSTSTSTPPRLSATDALLAERRTRSRRRSRSARSARRPRPPASRASRPASRDRRRPARRLHRRHRAAPPVRPRDGRIAAHGRLSAVASCAAWGVRAAVCSVLRARGRR